MYWEGKFLRKILDRGYGYYVDGSVYELTFDDNRLSAKVSGSEEYDVVIEFDEDDIKHMSCSCPYAADGHNCKHMAAVLYEWFSDEYDDEEDDIDFDDYEEDGIDFDEDEYDDYEGYHSSHDQIDKDILSASESQMRSFLSQALHADSLLYAKFKVFINDKIDKSDIEKYKSMVEDIIDEYSDRYDCITYRYALDFSYAMMDFLKYHVKEIIDKRCYFEAFDIIAYMFEKLSFIEIDDSDGGLTMFAMAAYEMWEMILAYCDYNTKDKIYHSLKPYMSNHYMDYMQDYAVDLFIKHFNEERYLDDKLSYAKNQIIKAKSEYEKWRVTYEMDKWVSFALDILYLSKASDDMINQFCKENWECSKAREYMIDKYLSSRQYDNAIEVLKESIEIDKDNSYTSVLNYRYKLKNLYKALYKLDEYKETLWFLITENDKGNVECYNEYKSLFSEEEWPIHCALLLNALPIKYKANVYVEEKMYDRLLDYVVNVPGLYTLMHYENLLKDTYYKELLDKYEKELFSMSQHASGRDAYREWVRLLNRMLKLKTGSQRVYNIVAVWKTKYRNRPALMDELRKLKL